jgi:DNA-binding Lrp family transcriptional regulator
MVPPGGAIDGPGLRANVLARRHLLMKNKILEILRTEARVSNAQIARRLDVTEAEVEACVNGLEKSKTVLGYRAIINPEKLDEEPCLGIIEVKITPQRDVGYDEIAAQIYRFPEVYLCYLISGGFDLLVFVEGKTLKDVAMFVSQKLATVEHVTATATHFILKKYKEAGVTMGDVEQLERLPVVP